jgi:branched-chain amino acid transport system permease protein
VSARRGTLAALVLAVVLGALAAGATNLARYTLDVGTTLLVLIAVAQAWNLLAGFSRQFSLGVSAFVGTGAYAATLVMIHLGSGPLTAVLCGAVASAVLAVCLSPALLRLRGDYLTIGTLAAALAVQAWAVNASSVGGSSGLNVPLEVIPDNVTLFRLAVLVVLACSLATLWFMSSSVGLRMSAVGQDPDAAVTLGVNVWRLRLLALVVSSALTGAAGSVVALQQVHVEPIGTLGLTWTIDAILMTVVGGAGTLVGPALGAVIIHLGLTRQLGENPVLGLVLEGLLLILVIRFVPRGIWPTVRDGVVRLVRRPAPTPPPEVAPVPVEPRREPVA